MLKDWVSSMIKNSKLDSLSSGSLLKFIFLMSKAPGWLYFSLIFGSFLLIVDWFILFAFFYWTFCFITIFFISWMFLWSSFSYNCFTISVMSVFYPLSINYFIRLSNCIRRSSNDNLENKHQSLPYKVPIIRLGLFRILWTDIIKIIAWWLATFEKNGLDYLGDVVTVLKPHSIFTRNRHNTLLI